MKENKTGSSTKYSKQKLKINRTLVDKLNYYIHYTRKQISWYWCYKNDAIIEWLGHSSYIYSHRNKNNMNNCKKNEEKKIKSKFNNTYSFMCRTLDRQLYVCNFRVRTLLSLFVWQSVLVVNLRNKPIRELNKNYYLPDLTFNPILTATTYHW